MTDKIPKEDLAMMGGLIKRRDKSRYNVPPGKVVGVLLNGKWEYFTMDEYKEYRKKRHIPPTITWDEIGDSPEDIVQYWLNEFKKLERTKPYIKEED